MNFKKLGLTAFVAILSALVTIGVYHYIDGKNQSATFEQKQAAGQFAQVNYGPSSDIPPSLDFRFAALPDFTPST